MAVSRIKVNGNFGSRSDLAIGDVVTLTNGDNVGATSWLWELLFVPPSSVAVLIGEATASATFTIDKEGSYLVRLTVNGLLQDIQYAAVRTLPLGLRSPAAGETFQDDVNYGWAISGNDNLARVEKGMRHSHRLVGVALDSIAVGVVYVSGTGTLANGDTVSAVDQASASSGVTSKNLGWALAIAIVDEPVTFITFGPTGPITGFDTTGAAVGDPVYLKNDGSAGLTPGTGVVVIGKVIGPLAVAGRFFFNPESSVSGSLATNNPTQIDAADVAAIGVSAFAAREDHGHAVNTAGSGDLAAVGATAAAGTSVKIPRADHVHSHGALSDPAMHAVASPSVNGFMSSTDKTKLNGISAGAATVSDVNPLAVGFNPASPGTGVDASRYDHIHQLLAAAPVAVSVANVEGTSSYVARADHVHQDNAGRQEWFSLVPAPISANVDDYDPGLVDASVLNLATSGGPWNVTGLVPGSVGGAQTLLIVNYGPDTLTLKHASGSSAAANRFQLPLGQDLVLGVGQGVLLNYDGDNTNWNTYATSTVLTTSVPVTSDAAAAAVGTANKAARSDHKHDVATAAPITVTKAANAAGSSTSLSRADHKHDVDTDVAVTIDTNSSNAEGSATKLARADHTHEVNVLSSAASSGTDATTASATDVLMTGMTLTPGAGDYFASFTADADHSSPTDSITISLYVNSVQVANSERTILPGTLRASMALSYLLTGVGASQAIEIQWRTTAATATVHKRALTLLKVG